MFTATLATALGHGGISIFYLDGIAENAPSAWANLRCGEIHRQWLSAPDGETIDEILIVRIAPDEYLLTGHGGSGCTLAIAETLKTFGYAPAGKPLFSGWGEMMARCRAEEQVDALAAAIASPDADKNFSRDRWEKFLRPRVVLIVGAVNAGKSSLFNCWLGGAHARVSARAGTTRDPVRREITVDGITLDLRDTAGISPPASPLDQIAIARGKNQWRDADLLVFVCGDNWQNNRDAARLISEFYAENSVSAPRIIVAQNKIDRRDNCRAPENFWADFPILKSARCVKISCRDQRGVTELLTLIANTLRGL